MTNLNKSRNKFLVNTVSGEAQTEESWESDFDAIADKNEQTREEFFEDLVEIEVDPTQEIFVVYEGEKSIEKMSVADYASAVDESIDASESRLIEAGDKSGICAYDNIKEATEYLFQLVHADAEEKGSSASQYAAIYNNMADAEADMELSVKMLDETFAAEISGHDGTDSIDFTDGSFVTFNNMEAVDHDACEDDDE